MALNFSYFMSPVTNTIPNRTLKLSECIALIKSDIYKELCVKARQLKKDGKEDELREYKAKKFDYVTFPGIFSKREQSAWLEHSGLFCADVDGIKNLIEVKERLKSDKYTMGVWNSATDGLRVLIQIPNVKEDFSDYVESYYKYLADNFGIIGKVDSKVKNPSQPCFLSWDNELYYNENSILWDRKENKEVIVINEKNFSQYSEKTLKAMLKHIPCRGWGEHTFHIMLSLIHYGKYRGKDYFGLFRWWIEQFKGGIKTEDLEDKWKKYSTQEIEKPVTIKSLVKEAIEHGYTSSENRGSDNALLNAYDEIYDTACKIVSDEFIVEDSYGIVYRYVNKQGYTVTSENDLIDILASNMRVYYALDSKMRNQYLTAMHIAAREKFKTLKTLNPPYSVFVNDAYIFQNKNITKIYQDYFYMNCIPQEKKYGDFEKIKSFISSYGDFEQLCELIAYLCIDGNPLKLLFCFYGTQDTGKTTLQEFIVKFVGKHNCSSGNLKLLSDSSQRFEIAQALRGKLIVFCNELDGKNVYDTAILKSLSGNDDQRAEYKGKNGTQNFKFGGKVIILCNDIPQLSDVSDYPFMSRVVIFEFTKVFERGSLSPVLLIGEEEYKYFSNHIQSIINRWVTSGKIDIRNIGTVDERITQYAVKSDPLGIFIQQECDITNKENIIPSWQFRDYFTTWQAKRGSKIWDERRIGHRMKELKFDRVQKIINERPIWHYKGIQITTKTSKITSDNQKTTMSSCLASYGETIRTSGFSVSTGYPTHKNDLLVPNHPVVRDVLVKDNPWFNDSELDNAILKAKERGDIVEHPSGYYRTLK